MAMATETIFSQYCSFNLTQ